ARAEDNGEHGVEVNELPAWCEGKRVRSFSPGTTQVCTRVGTPIRLPGCSRELHVRLNSAPWE
ncbi:Hypothetical predicted protein, partial [Marmota monax]